MKKHFLTIFIGLGICSSIVKSQSSYTCSWFGASYPGNIVNGIRLTQQITHFDIDVTSDGKVVSVTPWDEANKHISAFWGEANGGKVQHQRTGIAGFVRGKNPSSITTDDTYLYFTYNPTGSAIEIKRYRISDLTSYGKSREVVKAPAGSMIFGLAAWNQKVYAGDRIKGFIRVYTTGFEMFEVDRITCARPRKIAVVDDDNFWVLQGGVDESDIHPGTNAKVIKYHKNEGGWVKELILENVILPTGIAIDKSDRSRLLVADSDPLRNNIRIYNSTSGEFLSTFGRSILSDIPGKVEPDKFDYITGLGTDAEGNYYVSWNGGQDGGGRDGKGVVLRSLTPEGELRWENLSLEFVDNAAADPHDETQVFTKNERFVMDYSKPAGEQATWVGYTTDRRNTSDRRLTNVFCYVTQVVRLDGVPFAIMSNQRKEFFTFYRFEGELMVPCMEFDVNQRAIWRDGSNGFPFDGRVQEGEKSPYHGFSYKTGYCDEDGDFWMAGNTEIVHYFEYLGLDQNGIPEYSSSSARHYPVPDGGKCQAMEYNTKYKTAFMLIGNLDDGLKEELVRFDNFPNEPVEVSRVQVGEMKNTNCLDCTIAFGAMFPYVFEGRRFGQPIHVYNTDDGTKVTSWQPGPEVGGPEWPGTGLDLAMAVRPYKRENGEILVFTEEVSYTKILMHQWIPDINAPKVTINYPVDKLQLKQDTSIVVEVSVNSNIDIGKVEFYLDNQKINELSGTPYSITLNNLKPGNRSLKVKAININGGFEYDAVNFSVDGEPEITFLFPAEGSIIKNDSTLVIKADIQDPDGIANVQFLIDTSFLGQVDTEPYEISVPVEYLLPGSREFSVIATDNLGGKGKATVSVEVIPAETCPGSGTILVENWMGYPGASISDIPDINNLNPDTIYYPPLFESISNFGNDMITRIRGYICPPENGKYVFWCAGDDATDLYISTSEMPGDKIRIAYNTGWAGPRQWDKFPSQKSDSIELVAGKLYYIELLVKESGGGDNAAAGWQLPSGLMERPIPGTRLLPEIITWQPSPKNPPVVEIILPSKDTTIQEGEKIPFVARAYDPDGSVNKVVFYNNGDMLGNGMLSGEEYIFEINQATPGAMTVYAEATDNDGLKSASGYLTIEIQGVFTSEINHIRKRVSQQRIIIFPNPATYQEISYHLEGNQSFPVLFEIFDIEGRMVYNQSIEKSAGTLDIGYLPPGLYIVKCVTRDVINTTKLILK